MRVDVDDLSLRPVGRDPDRETADPRARDGHVGQHLQRLPVQRLAVRDGVGEGQEPAVDEGNLDQDQPEDGDHAERAQAPAWALGAEHEDERQDGDRQVRAARKGNDHPGEDQRAERCGYPSLPRTRGKQRETDRERERGLQIHGVVVGARVEKRGCGAEVEVVIRDRAQEGNDLARRVDRDARAHDDEERRDVPAIPEQVDRDVIHRDRLEKIGAVDAERRHLAGRVDDADDTSEKQQTDRYV